ncbi:hydroxyethylthiazole kinase [Lactiplantibacillus sp. WILCCON 0030]|uniref:Hydroxyethylthiazole kinase n=1 Tax=Lactiplantibacillus brownii TaxID=3069269 RepID=A0ABU1A526_9LACO|nr:hydroxyethylthiazole kinase [Lactiplantibacillus brownii]MDQ7936100.1 hydroxyethylthiazole kinase [Lactiplantibacillus brownii]
MNLDLLTTLREQNPIVFNIANFVTVQDVANGLNAIGASPIMSAEPIEAPDMVKIAGAICLNLGTLTQRQVEQMKVVGQLANQQQKPIVLDPVAVGASTYRHDVAQRLLETFKVAVIRGNAGEIATLAGIDWQAKGIDAGSGDGDLIKIAQTCALKYHCVVVLSGPTDVVTDGKRVIQVHNGTPLFQLHVGSGDLLSSLVAAFTAVSGDDYFEAAQTACLVLAVTGQLVVKQMTADRPGTFAFELLDKLHLITIEEVKRLASIS